MGMIIQKSTGNQLNLAYSGLSFWINLHEPIINQAVTQAVKKE
jgi:hypothetical protein